MRGFAASSGKRRRNPTVQGPDIQQSSWRRRRKSRWRSICLNFGLTLEAVAEEYRPNFLCNYLYELAGKFTAFYENCPVLKADDDLRASRLALCDLTARVLKQGLDVLGIEVVEQM